MVNVYNMNSKRQQITGIITLIFLQKKTKSHRKDGSTGKVLEVTLDSTATSQSQRGASGQIKANEITQAESQWSITENNGKERIDDEFSQLITEISTTETTEAQICKM